LIQLDTDYVFEKVGGPKGLLDLLDKHASDHQVNYPTIQMWKHRHTIPGKYLPAVLYALQREGVAMAQCFYDDTEFS
jgi:hypothetical protein